MANNVRVTLCCRPYDLTQPMIYGQVDMPGIDLTWIPFDVDAFWRMLSHQEFDVSETSMNTYLMTRASGAPVTAIPVFPHRRFRHSYIYVNTGSGIERPEDLAGKRMGVPEYQITAAVWVRGILQDEYGVPPTAIRWYESRQVDRSPFERPAGLHLEKLPPGDRNLEVLLARGDLDAVMGPGIPELYLQHKNVRRLFPDFQAAERDYYLRTGIFPIMHVIVVRTAMLEAYPWLAGSLLKAFQRSKQLCYRRMQDARLWALVWNRAQLEAERQVFGEDAFPYGIEPNRKAIETLIRYSVEQGLLRARPESVESLFAASVTDPRYYVHASNDE